MNEQSHILQTPSEYFKDRIVVASQQLKVQLSNELEFYLVKLLCDFIRPPEVEGEPSVLDAPLVHYLQKAQETESSEARLKVLRQLGDTSLYMSGFFQDYFNRKLFDIGYYINLGSMAYGNAAQLSKIRQDQVVFQDLAAHFSVIVDVVAEVSEQQKPHDNKDVLALYDRWSRSQSERLKKILIEQGIQPIAGTIKTAQ